MIGVSTDTDCGKVHAFLMNLSFQLMIWAAHSLSLLIIWIVWYLTYLATMPVETASENAEDPEIANGHQNLNIGHS